jgi:hypothetical protein
MICLDRRQDTGNGTFDRPAVSSLTKPSFA